MDSESWKIKYIKMTLDQCKRQMDNIVKTIKDADEEYCKRKCWIMDCETEEDIKGCDFCRNLDFGVYKTSVSGKYATIYTAGGSSRFAKHEQFKYCPNCGDKM